MVNFCVLLVFFNEFKVKTKKLYSILKHALQYSNSIVSLKANRKNVATEPAKAYAHNQQFYSVFSFKSQISHKSLAQRALWDLSNSGINLPFRPCLYSKILVIQLSEGGIEELLQGLNPHKLLDLII